LDDAGSCEVIHYKVEVDCNGSYSVDPEVTFPTVLSLVKYYKG